jgi:hypothetical protein
MRQDVVERLPQIVAYLRIRGVREQDVDIAHDNPGVCARARAGWSGGSGGGAVLRTRVTTISN